MIFKTERLLIIKELINSNKIPNQEKFMNLLNEKGLYTTQATLSRDLKQLKAYKIVDPKEGYIYAIKNSSIDKSNELSYSFASKGFISIEFANNLAVIKSLPGYAGSIASMIDKENLTEITGTIAGDDTILIIPAEGVLQKNIIQSLRLIIPELKVIRR